MKKILVNYDSFKDRNILTQTIKIISMNYKDLEIIAYSKETIPELTNFERITYSNELNKDYDFLVDNSFLCETNISLIRSPSTNFLFCNLVEEDFISFSKELNEPFSSLIPLKEENELFKEKIALEDIFTSKTKLLLTDKDNYEFFFKALNLFKNYFIAQSTKKESSKGTFSKLNDYFFKNFSSNNTNDNKNLYTDICYPIKFLYKENKKMTISFEETATINDLIKGFNIVYSILNKELDLINK